MEFADILDGLGRTARTDEDHASSAPRGARPTPDFWRILDGFSRKAGVADSATRAEYRANVGRAPEPLREASPREAPLSLDPDDIADELDLDACETLEDVRTVRRLFARQNHPDGVPAEQRERANARMTLANAMIDEAARRFAR